MSRLVSNENPLAHVTSSKLKGDVRWAHAVNTRSELDAALNSDIDCIEVDVLLSADEKPIAAHPPAKQSNLSIAHLLERLAPTSIGLKLDFKDEASVMPVILELVNRPLAQPVFLNADILPGIGGGAPAVNAEWFLQACDLYPGGVLSLGWTTDASHEAYYSEEDISQMLALTKSLDVVTFPIRAYRLPASWAAVRRLIDRPNRSLTLWDSEPLTPELKSWIRLNTNPALCYYDVDLSL